MQLPAEWITHNTVNFQPPAARTFDLASYPKVKQSGPRAEQVTAACAAGRPTHHDTAETTFPTAYALHYGWQQAARLICVHKQGLHHSHAGSCHAAAGGTAYWRLPRWHCHSFTRVWAAAVAHRLHVAARACRNFASCCSRLQQSRPQRHPQLLWRQRTGQHSSHMTYRG
jgi:hypothetical protein